MKVIDETEADLRALIERDLGKLPASTDFGRALLDWLHFRARSIPQRPRAVIMSPEVKAKIKTFPAILRVRDALQKGKDVSPWLSDSIRKKPADPRADMMFNDWQITHFHLGSIFVRKDKISRSNDLLFAFIAPNHAVLLDVQAHGSWAMRDLLRILLRVSPKDFPEIKGILGSPRSWTDEEILKLRKSGRVAPIDIDGRSFMAPGLGISTSKHATRIVRAADAIKLTIAKVVTDLENNSVALPLLRQLSRSIAIPVRLGVRIEAGQLVLCDKNRNLGIVRLMPLLR